MEKEKLQQLSNEELLKKEKGAKTLFYLFIPIVLCLFFFPLKDYFGGEELDLPSFTIAICSVGGMVSLWPSIKAFQGERKERGI